VYNFFQNKTCEFFPCHNIKTINCIFCFCPLYEYDCPGNYTYTNQGVKDCSNCNYPHNEEGYNNIIKYLKEKRG